MQLGVSIQSDGLRNDAELEERKKYLAGFWNVNDYLNFLKSHEIENIEIRIYKREETYKSFQEAIEMIWDKGFELTIHGDLTGSFHRGETFSELYPSLKPIIEKFHLYQSKLIIPIHAYQSSSLLVPALKKDTIHLFNKWISFIQSEELNIYFALENNRQKSIHDPCNHIDGVVTIVNEINSDHLGICWDMGHYYSNLIHRLDDSHNMEALTPFINRVIHTHIHGLNDQKVTHFPLSKYNSLPLEEYVSLLKNADYDGVYNLELSFDRWGKGLNVQDELVRSIDRLKNS